MLRAVTVRSFVQPVAKHGKGYIFFASAVANRTIRQIQNPAVENGRYRTMICINNYLMYSCVPFCEKMIEHMQR